MKTIIKPPSHTHTSTPSRRPPQGEQPPPRTRHTTKTSFKWSIHARALQQIVNYPARARPLTSHKSTYALSAYFVQRKNHCHSIHSDLVCLVYRPIDPRPLSRATVVLHSPGLAIGSQRHSVHYVLHHKNVCTIDHRPFSLPASTFRVA